MMVWLLACTSVAPAPSPSNGNTGTPASTQDTGEPALPTFDNEALAPSWTSDQVADRLGSALGNMPNPAEAFETYANLVAQGDSICPGSERIIVDSSADWGVSDPLSVPKTAALMIERGVPHEDVVKTTWQNALDAYAQSGQIDEEELLSSAQVDQTQLFSDNSVLRGQEPRVGEAVPN